jgi:sigma-B regulation protein RsbU (phosphoserine phosphatase)
MYITIFPKTRRLRYCCAGHPPGFIIRKNGTILDLDQSTGIFLGMFADEPYTTVDIGLEPGDRIVLYSDGITEIRDLSANEFGIDSLKSSIMAAIHLSPDAALIHLKTTLDQFGTLKDDQTIVIVDIN